MSELNQKVVFENNFGSTLEITDCYDITINMGSEIKNNTATVKLANSVTNLFLDGTLKYRYTQGVSQSIFSVVKATQSDAIAEDFIDIYANYEEVNPTTDIEDSSYLLFSGTITKAEIEWSNSTNGMALTMRDRSQLILDALAVPQGFKESDGENAPRLIQRIVRGATDGASNTYGYDESGNYVANAPYRIDARLFSDSIVDSGTTDATPETNKLVDTGQNFTSTVSIGDWVRNTDTEEYAYVVSVDSDTELTLTKDIMSSGSEGFQISNGFIQDKRPDGSGFPNIAFNFLTQPASKYISELSQISNTNDSDEQDSTLVVKRAVRYYIDSKNRLHWYVPSNTPEYIMSAGQTAAISPDLIYHRIHKIKLTHSVDDVINFIIYKAGPDMDGVQISGFARAQFSGSPNKKDSLRVWEDISRWMKKQDAVDGNISKVNEDEYSYPTSYPVTPSWDSQGRSVANDSEYNTNFKEEAKRIAFANCQAIFKQEASPKWKGSIELRGENINVGDLIQVTSQAHGIKNIKVRVNQITHSIKNNIGWITSLTVEEDELESPTLIFEV